MKTTRWQVWAVMLVASGCPRPDGPGFYGKVNLAGGNAAATQLVDARNNDTVKQVVRLMLPAEMRVGFNRLLDATAMQRVPKRAPQAVPRMPVVERWREGEVMVRTAVAQRANRQDVEHALLATLDPGFSVSLKLCNTADFCLWRVAGPDGKLLDAHKTRDAAQHMQRAQHVRWAAINSVLQALAVPNDEFFPLQWHYNLMNLPTAWDVTTGDSSVVAAVIDTGVSTLNGDLTGRLGRGADLISEPSISNDGDGRDDDPEDPGDEAAGGGSFHGTHVAGTVGAATDNNTGVAGVSWSGTILPVRVLGIGGGTSFDILGGIQWALGLPVDGVTQNNRPADVISMSLGAPGPTSSYEDIIHDAVTAGALVFVAAGNDNVDAASYTPAGVPEAITVGATNLVGGRASYSNYGSVVDIMAPGGEMIEDRNNDGYADGVLSTVQRSFDFLQGTSMAAPHMSGLGVLMKTLRRGITQQEAAQLIRDTMRTDPEFVCTECGGAGLVDAAAVVAQLSTNANDPFLSVSPSQVYFAGDENSITVTVRNSGGASLDWNAAFSGASPPFTVMPASGTLAPRQSMEVQVRVSVDRGQAPSGHATLVFSDATQTRPVDVRYEEALTHKRPQIDEAVVGALVREGEDLKVAKDKNNDDAAVLAKRSGNFEYKVQPLAEGDYMLVGITDDNGNGSWDDGEGVGLYPDLANPQFIHLPDNQKLTGADFIIRPSFTGSAAPCPDNATRDGQNCVCNSGYKVSTDGHSCEPR